MKNIYTEKKMLIEVLERLTEVLDEMEKDCHQVYKCVGKETEQARSWRTDELLWTDEEKTIPLYRDRYEYVPLADDEMDDEQRAKVKAIETISKALEKLV